MQCIFIGYCETSKAYRLYNREIRKLIISRDVIFQEGNITEVTPIVLTEEKLQDAEAEIKQEQEGQNNPR